MTSFTDVRDYLRSTPYKFHTIRKGFTLSSGILFETRFNGDINFDTLVEIFETLIRDFKYQFVFSIINPEATYNRVVVKFDFENFKRSPWKKNEEVLILFQPTEKLKLESTLLYKPKDYLFHITNRNNLNSILKDGLKPFGRNQGPKGYNYPPMIHFLVNLNCMATLKDGDLVGPGNWKQDLIMFKIDPSNHKFLLDPACDVGLISYESIDKRDISLVRKEEYPELFNKYTLSNYKPLFMNFSWWADI